MFIKLVYYGHFFSPKVEVLRLAYINCNPPSLPLLFFCFLPFFFSSLSCTSHFCGRRERERRRSPRSSHRERKLAPEILRRLFPSRGGRRRLLFYPSGSAASRSSPRRFPRMDCARIPNPFRLCSALRVLGSFMVLLVLAIVALSYYAVVVVAWGPRLFHRFPVSVIASAVIVVFHLLLALLIWSYFMVVFHDPGSVPANWRPSLDEESLDRTISVTQADHIPQDTRASTSSTLEGHERRPNISYCTRCQNGKPPRCHHCSVCQRCVLKMDHHCVWVVNCVGAQNYKFFLLFLLYTFLETVLDSFALLPNFIKFFGDARKHSGSPGNLAVTFLAFVLNLAFALSLLCFVVMHTSLVLSNTTTIEVYEKKKVFVWKYDLGKRKNFEQVFGTKKLLWFLPLFSSEDLERIPALQGLEFPTRSDVER